MSDVHQRKTFGIVFALGVETRGMRRVFSQSRQLHTDNPAQTAWKVGGVRVLMEVSGMGRRLCSAATHRLIDQGAAWIACAGFAAALDTKARVGDVVMADSVILAGGEFPAIECNPALMASTPPSGRLGFSVWRSDMITSDRVILHASEKSSIYRDTGAAALDMEAYAAAEACHIRRVPFVVIKGISDTAEQDLPEEVEALAAAQRWVDQLGLIASRPTLWPQLWRLRKNTLLAADNLGDVLGTMLLRLFG